MVRNPLGIKVWYYSDIDKTYIYLDLGKKYYDYFIDELVVSNYEEDDTELQIGPKTLILWSE